MAKRKKIIPEEGDLVAIKLSDGKFGLAQIAGVKKDDSGFVVHTIWAFFDAHSDYLTDLEQYIGKPGYLETPFLVCGMDYEELEKGKWPVLGTKPVAFTNASLDETAVAKLQKEEIAGAYLLEMYLGIVPWNMYKDPEYLDKRLLPGYNRPENVLLK